MTLTNNANKTSKWAKTLIIFGPIVTLASPQEGKIYLLNGQQRLATATILFSVLRDLAREVGKSTGTQAGGDFAANLLPT
jgi:hypothetical protein